MGSPFRKATSIVDKDFAPGSEHNEILSIEILPGGFSYAILDSTQYRYMVLEHFVSDEQGHHGHLPYDAWQSFLDQQPWLKHPFLRIHVSWFSPHLVLIPNEIAAFGDQKSLLQFACGIPHDHSVKSDRLNNLNGFGVYSIPNWLLHLIESNFPFYRLRHTGSVCIESMLSTIQLENQHPDVFIHIRRSSFDIILLENKKLTFFQIFTYQQFDDLLYLLFYVVKQFGLTASDLRVLLAGEISMDSDRYSMLASYFGKVGFVARNDMYKYTDGFDNIPHHYFYSLLHLNSCG